MSIIRSVGPPALFIGGLSLAIVVLGMASARADTMTYSFGPYVFPDSNTPANTDTVSGTVTLTNTAGSVFTTYHAGAPSLANVFMSGVLTMSSSNGSIVPVTVAAPATSIGADSGSFVNFLNSGSLTATPAGLYLSDPGYLTINYENNTSFPPVISGHIDTGDANGNLFLFANPGGGFNGGAATMEFFPQNLNAQSPPEFGSGSWEIGTAVPEPATLTLLGAALLAVGGAVSIRRMRAA